MALSPDGALLAAGDPEGRVHIWRVGDGERIGTFMVDRVSINCLLFGRDPLRRAGGPPWLLAAGDAGGTAAVWDLVTKAPRMLGRGSHYDIYALAFSADGTTLATTGRESVHIWDISSGRVLLELSVRGYFSRCLAFSADGRYLAVGANGGFGSSIGTQVWRIDNGRGLSSLRGLSGGVTKAVFSTEGRLVAALAQNWQVGLWDRETGQLLHVLEGPRGVTADNAALAFSPDGRRFAACAGAGAKLWDVGTGQELRAWALPMGLVDQLAFREPDRLLLFRLEATGLRDSPYLCRIRDLLGDAARPIAEIDDFNWGVHDAVVSPDGTVFVAEGVGGRRDTPTRTTNAYDAATGRRLWSLPSPSPLDVGVRLSFDPTGHVLERPVWIGPIEQLSMPGGELLRRIDDPRRRTLLGPDGRRWVYMARGGYLSMPDEPDRRDSNSFYLYAKERQEPLLRIASSGPMGSIYSEFTRDGRYVVWGNPDGTVSVLDLVSVQERMASLGLGW